MTNKAILKTIHIDAWDISTRLYFLSQIIKAQAQDATDTAQAEHLARLAETAGTLSDDIQNAVIQQYIPNNTEYTYNLFF